MEKGKKTKQIAIRFDSDSYEQIEFYSKMEHREVSAFIRHIVLEYLEKSEEAKNEKSKGR